MNGRLQAAPRIRFGTGEIGQHPGVNLTNSGATALPGDDRAATVFPSREYVYIIELETMQVLWAEQAFFVNPTITQTGMDVLEGYLTE